LLRRCDQAHHGAQGHEEHDLVVAFKQGADFIAQRAVVGAYRIRQAGKLRRKLGGSADVGAGQVGGQACSLRRAVLRDGYQA